VFSFLCLAVFCLKVSPGVDGNVHVLYSGYMVEGIVKEEGVTYKGWGLVYGVEEWRRPN